MRWWWISLAALPLVMVAVAYLYLGGLDGLSQAAGSKQVLGPVDSATSPSAAGPSKPVKALSEEQLERMVAHAVALTKKDPKDASAWALVAHSYEMLGKFSDSVKAYATLAQLLPGDAQVLADYADVLAVSNGRSFKGEPRALLQRALSMDPSNAKALALTGSAHLEEGDQAQALLYLERARAVSSDPAFSSQIEAGIAHAKAVSGAPAGAPGSSVAPASTGMAAAAGAVKVPAQVSGRVWLAEGLRAKVPAQAVVFLYARPVEGSRMPVALLRKKVSDLPLNFSLDDSMAMNPASNLSTLNKVVVVARISLRGDVTPQAGDLEARTLPVSVGAKDLKLEIAEALK